MKAEQPLRIKAFKLYNERTRLNKISLT